jgi:hypothetical protein
MIIRKSLYKIVFWFIVAGITTSCHHPIQTTGTPKEETKVNAKFVLLSPDETGISFSNLSDFKEDYNYNIFKYEYLYNGGGVAAGDVNGDSLPDLYFTASFGGNKLYINSGNFKFVDATDRAGVKAEAGFKTGVVMADINGDGKMDIYVCRTGNTDDGLKTNHTFINMGNTIENGIAIPRFEDQSKKLGLDDNSNSNHACFFDYDRDGDLDLFLLNHRIDFTESTNLRVHEGPDGSIIRVTTPSSPFESNRMYKNDKGHFVDVTKQSGVESSAFSLSVTPADFDRDGWMDLYIANDYIEPDRILINNHNGSFTDHYKYYLRHSSLNSMGSDVADINNDGLDDIMVLDMKSEDPVRYKSLVNGMHYDRYNLLVDYGYGRQVGRNVIQLNNGNNTFSEIGQYAGVAATDWSWASLIADFDNDGWKDIYVSDGYRRDVANLDYLNYVRDSLNQTGGLSSKRFPDINSILAYLPEKKLSNYLFINDRQLSFVNGSVQAGMDTPSFSNGSAFADLDRDGDLDLIVNNIEDPAFIYRNDMKGQHWIQLDLETENGNHDAVGAIADLFMEAGHQHQMLITNKGFFSSSEPILHFGLGNAEKIDSIILQWPDGRKEILKAVQADQRIYWHEGTAESYTEKPKPSQPPLFNNSTTIQGWMHQENDFVDFKREKLLPYMLSYEGPCISTGDVNGDKLEDIYAGNGSDFRKKLFIQNANGMFKDVPVAAFIQDSIYEDCGSVLKDFDQDGDQDLMVISGGNAFPLNDPKYMCRYYINDGKGQFNRSADFPVIRTNAGAILAVDYDGDQDLDVIIGGRSVPGRYPESPRSYLLKNDKGQFRDVTHEVFQDLEQLGMITDITSGDIDGDHQEEILFAGEWIPISVFGYDGKIFKNKTTSFNLGKTSGWWKSIELADMDQDGDLDLWAGNLGLNSRLVTSEEKPVTMVAKDFDGNGSIDPILCFYYNDQLFPYAGRDEIIGQIPMLKKKFGRYSTYATATLYDVFTKEQLEGSITLTVNTFQTSYFVNEKNKFIPHTIPYQVQLAPVFDMIIDDFNHDGRKDVLMAGNFLYAETETGEMDAGNGTLLLQNEDGTFRYIPNVEHGFWAQGEVRELKKVLLANGEQAILTGNNQGPIEVHVIQHSKVNEN